MGVGWGEGHDAGLRVGHGSGGRVKSFVSPLVLGKARRPSQMLL